MEVRANMLMDNISGSLPERGLQEILASFVPLSEEAT